MKVLILDDETDRAMRWQSVLSKLVNSEFVVYEKKDVSVLISELHRARFESRKGVFKPVNGLDGFDLVIVDYDLLGLEMENPAAWATGAELAYSMRLMSSIGPIVVVNQFGTNTFDLTMRRGISSYADVDVGSAQITSLGLWSSKDFQGFRPWHWPDLHREVERFSLVHGFVKENINKSVMEVLSFELEDADSPNFISYEIAALLGVGVNNKNLTFRDVVINNSGLRVFNILEKDKEILDVMTDDQVARVCSSILIHWLEKVVLPAQEVVADAPHLCAQLPWAIDYFQNIEKWNEVCSLDESAVPALFSNYHVQPDFLFSRPVFWAEKARRDILMPDDFEFDCLPKVQFCENLSVFSLEESASSFPSDVIAFDKKRWVRCDKESGASGVNYEPQSYLLM
jgi:hypothetical protein